MEDVLEVRSASEIEALPADARGVKGHDLADDDLAGLPRLESLEALHLDGCTGIGDAGLERVGRCPSLTEFFTSGNGITDDGLRHLVGLPRLAELGLDARITGAGFRHLSALPALATLHLPACPELTPEGIRVLAALPALRTLNFYSCPRLDDGWLAALQDLEGLTKVTLFRCAGVTDEGVRALEEARPGLEVERI